MAADYKSTVYLPQTDFPMRGGLPEREPQILARWDKLDLYRRQREASAGKDKFILHDGPPYANGNLHIGHALNKILKDVINRSQQMLGRDANYVPGWDCHGLPIEWKIEEKYRKAGKDKDQVPVAEFRRECREFAAHWIDVQREEFKRLGVIGDWDNPYTTMTYAAEAQIVRELGKFLMNGGLYRGAKPVMWSPVEKTALAEAEIEYHDHKSTQIWVRFPVATPSVPALDGAAVAIWTTTPWTIPGNRAVAFGEDLSYVVMEVAGIAEDSAARVGERLVLAAQRASVFADAVGIAEFTIRETLAGADLKDTVCRHPLHGQGYDFDVPLLPGDHVTDKDGTGLVHTAPGHGVEDYEVGLKFGLDVPQTVGPDGLYFDHVPLFAGQHVYKADGPMVDALAATGALLATATLVHSYPHSWRSKAPLIYRNTPQWFISMDKNGLRDKALAAIGQTAFFPPSGQNRLRGMIESRPDWCVSRQRAWGVPITVFFSKETGEPLRDEKVLQRIVDAVEKEGADCWFTGDPGRFLGDDHDPDDFEQVTDILDVWFDSGATHSFVLEARDDLQSPASLYLEGSDQHRGWFHSSLLESCGTRGRAPYDAVLTHGFVMAEEGVKMSKSQGNVISPQAVIKQYGADILRLWVVASDYSEDLKIGPEILKRQTDSYRRLRNTLRFLLGNLHRFDDSERLPFGELPELERYMLHRLAELDGLVRRCCDAFDFHTMFTALHNFCAVDLSAFYFDIRKDSLYCDRADSSTRRAARTVLDALFSHLTAWLAPIICFTAEEAWQSRFPDDTGSVHLRLFPDVPDDWLDNDLAGKWDRVRDVRRAVTARLEKERAAKKIGSSLQARPTIYLKDHQAAVGGIDWAEICITSDVEIVDSAPPAGTESLPDDLSVGVDFAMADGNKCERCWKVLPEVGTVSGYDDLCNRCADAVEHHAAAAE